MESFSHSSSDFDLLCVRLQRAASVAQCREIVRELEAFGAHRRRACAERRESAESDGRRRLTQSEILTSRDFVTC